MVLIVTTVASVADLTTNMPIAVAVIIPAGLALSLIAPVAIVVKISRLSSEYSADNVHYGASYRGDSIVWTTPQGTYECSYSSVSRVHDQSGISVLSIEGSRAIFVLPKEIFSAPIRERLA